MDGSRWRMSMRKWDKAVEILEWINNNKKAWAKDRKERGLLFCQIAKDGGEVLEILSPCGYCAEYKECERCPLNADGYCLSYDDPTEKTVFWDIVEALAGQRYKKALKLAIKMKTRIEQDGKEITTFECEEGDKEWD